MPHKALSQSLGTRLATPRVDVSTAVCSDVSRDLTASIRFEYKGRSQTPESLWSLEEERCQRVDKDTLTNAKHCLNTSRYSPLMISGGYKQERGEWNFLMRSEMTEGFRH